MLTAQKVEKFEDLKEPGQFLFTLGNTSLIFICPCGKCKDITCVPIITTSKGKGWAWNGSEDKPTLTPSLQRIEGCNWHGYLTDGVFRKC
jgi:hypothetical protein